MQKKYVLKVVVIGQFNVGKTSLQTRYIIDLFKSRNKSTLGCDYLTKELLIDDDVIILQFWDTAGQEKFQYLGQCFFRGADICILVYDITKQETFNEIEQWRQTFLMQSGPHNPETFPFLLLANKCDLIHEEHRRRKVYKSKYDDIEFMLVNGYCRTIEKQLYDGFIPMDVIVECIKFFDEISIGEKYANKHEMLFYETSAKDNINIQEAFQAIATKAYHRLKTDCYMESKFASTGLIVEQKDADDGNYMVLFVGSVILLLVTALYRYAK